MQHISHICVLFLFSMYLAGMSTRLEATQRTWRLLHVGVAASSGDQNISEPGNSYVTRDPDSQTKLSTWPLSVCFCNLILSSMRTQ